MTRRRAERPAWIVILLSGVVAALLAVLVAAPAVTAADVTFGRSTATQTYDEKIAFALDVTSAAPLARMELRIGFPDALGPYIVDVPVPPAGGSHTVTYDLDLTGGGHLVPNTPLTYTWAAFPDVGAEPVLSGTERLRYQDTTQDWKTLEGDLITVHWTKGGDAFARKALDIGEQAVKDTSALLGVTETEPIDFFIYPDEQSFRTALGPGTRENVGGQAHADIRTLFALIEPGAIDDPWVGIVVPHELTHLVFDTAVENPYRFPPRWLNEGLAVYLSEGYGSSDQNRVADAVDSRDLLPLVALGAQFPTDPDKTVLAYAESVSAIDYLVRQHGRDALVALVLAYKDGLTDNEALIKAPGEDMATFQAGWLSGLGAAAPEQFGPQPAPPGPLPSGWSGDAPNGQPDPLNPTSRPGTTPVPGEDRPVAASTQSASTPLLLGGLALVIGVVVVGLVIARRRSRAA